mmetsp:Transcript_12965/g.24081  ORF Transcript_12965/g.24081 Transcript_12965/m.24081 type:complete len:100 (+) Transcript_12965:951-1250(+)
MKCWKCWNCFTSCKKKPKPTSMSLSQVAPTDEHACSTGEDVIETIRRRIAKSFERQNFAPPKPLTSEVVSERVLIPVYMEAGKQFVDTGRSVEMIFTEH